MTAEVRENTLENRFEMAVEGEIAAIYYQVNDGNLVLVHTEVPQALSGRGIGSALAKGTFDLIGDSGRKAVVRCPFLVAWASRHPDVADLIVG